ncbi:calmin [Trematomus bernacchii]|uniref:calmin n=1 Tax=Trematomus bernacchii TaxID=40690 RepID=UPI00146C72B5|nr:calmin [Trematomus bernacchii]
MAGHEWFEREELIGQISDIRVQNLQVERELVQKRTFTRWMNLHLEKCDPPIEVNDLFRDIQDGHILMALLEEISGCKLLHGFKRSSHRIFRLNNIAKVLSFLEERNVKLVSIDAADVADGNSSIILGLIWNIILFFQIKELTGNIRSQFPSSSSLSSIPTNSDSDTSCSAPSGERQAAAAAMREHSNAIKKLLQWVQKRTRKYGVAVHDFGKSWKSGLAFLAVIKSIDPSLVDMRKAHLRTTKENLEDSFRIAHYSLGIHRLLEPEDLTINAPDEQSIMTYVSQFLEHFPGIEEPEERCQPIERSVSMGRINFRDSDTNHIRNSAYRSRVKERSYMFQKVSAQAPPKILISSVSEDRSAMSPPFRPPTARSWSVEDILADSPHTEDISSSVVEDPNESTSEVNTTCNSPQLPYSHSPTGSSVPESINTESVIGDSAIGSPDSWMESEFGVMPERFCESQSESSLCDSGTAWDVYRATPVEITNLDEGFVPSMEDRASHEQSNTESYIDEGIYSLSSLESTNERIHGHSEKKQDEVVKVKEANLENNNQEMVLEQEPDQSMDDITKEVDSRDMDTSQSREQEPSFGLCEAEERIHSGVEHLLETDQSNQSQLKQTLESAHGDPEYLEKAVDVNGNANDHEEQIKDATASQNERNNSEEIEGETECQKKDSPEETRGEPTEEAVVYKERDVGKQEESGVLREYPGPQESLSSETLANTHPSNTDGVSKTSLEPSRGINIPLISISSEPEEQDEEGTCVPESSDRAGEDEEHQAEGTDGEVNSPENPPELGCDSNDNVDKDSVESPSCLVSENVEPTESEQKRVIESLDEHDISGSSNSVICDNQTATTQQNTLDTGSVSTNMDLFYTDFDQNSHAEDLICDSIEPMDLFYPDKEEPMFTELPDVEMQSWPSVLSVSALQPAPASETDPDQLLDLLGEDYRERMDSILEDDEETNQEAEKESESQEACSLPGEPMGGRRGADVPAGGRDLSEAEQQSSGSAREITEPVRSDSRSSIRQDESQIPPVLRHRKGPRFTEAKDKETARTAAPGAVDNRDSSLWCGENSELYVLLLLLWLLLYCFLLLPQMDLKTLPSLLLNLDH